MGLRTGLHFWLSWDRRKDNILGNVINITAKRPVRIFSYLCTRSFKQYWTKETEEFLVFYKFPIKKSNLYIKKYILAVGFKKKRQASYRNSETNRKEFGIFPKHGVSHFAHPVDVHLQQFILGRLTTQLL
jgi:hypothetical protein